MDFINRINCYKEYIGIALQKYLAPNYPEVIYKAMSYSCLSSGKRLRPILLLSATNALGTCQEKALPFACAIEMIHTYSLIHDDLPAMDNDDLRRGKPTNHVIFGEAMSILAGDALLNRAFEIMIQSCIKSGEKSDLLAMEKIGFASGISGMIGGQVADVISENKIIDEETLLYIHNNKTGALITAALCAGAILGGADDKQLALFEKAGQNLGIAFQIRDDILDITSSDIILGKPVGSDTKNQKSTYVSIFGEKKANNDYKEFSQSAINILENIGDDFLIQYTKSLINREM